MLEWVHFATYVCFCRICCQAFEAVSKGAFLFVVQGGRTAQVPNAGEGLLASPILHPQSVYLGIEVRNRIPTILLSILS